MAVLFSRTYEDKGVQVSQTDLYQSVYAVASSRNEGSDQANQCPTFLQLWLECSFDGAP